MKLPRIRIRFGLRSMLIAVPLVGIWLGLIAHLEWVAKVQADTVAQLQQHGCTVTYEPRNNSFVEMCSHVGFLSRCLGSDVLETVSRVSCNANQHAWDRMVISDTELASVVQLLRKLPAKFSLAVGIDSETNLALLHNIPNLRGLSISLLPPPGSSHHMHWTLPGVTALRLLTGLKQLNLYGPEFSDAAIEQLATLRQLEAINLDNTFISKIGIDRLRRELPNCVFGGWDIFSDSLGTTGFPIPD